MLKRISITGPESTGKSWLSKKLALHFNTVFVGEYSVEYLSEFGPAYKKEDILEIAKGQLEREEKLSSKANNLLFCDTDILVNKIWSKVVFGDVPEWIEKKVNNHKYSLYLLCSPDLKWEKGPYRENAHDRENLFKLYENELKQMGANYRIVDGYGETRLKNAIKFVKEIC